MYKNKSRKLPVLPGDTMEIADIEEHVSKELSGFGGYSIMDVIKMVLLSPFKKIAGKKS